MPKLPKVAIVGRPNVGKSQLFNRLAKKRIAIVDEAEGVTRDRLYAEAEAFGKAFELIDTAGIDATSKELFQKEIQRQTEIAIEEADSLIMVVDATVGITSLDLAVAKILLKTGKPVCLAVNKVDDRSKMDATFEFYRLGIQEIIPISAIHGFHIAELLEKALEKLSFPEEQEHDDGSIKVAIIGRPNVGKSTLVNFLLDEERCVVSPIAGTTRDSIDAKLEIDGQLYTLIDTAGIKRKRAEQGAVEKFAAIRTERAIDRADVCVLIMDAREGITTQEKRIAGLIEEKGKGCVMLFNKWDLVKGFRMEHCLKGINLEASFLEHCPTLFSSALIGRNVDKLFPLIKKVHGEQNRRITTGQLNKFIEKRMQKYHPPMIGGKRLRIYYMAQIGVQPPAFVLFVNKPELMAASYKKYLINSFREEWGFSGCPLIFMLRGKEDEEKKEKESATESSSVPDIEELPDLQEELDSSYFD